MNDISQSAASQQVAELEHRFQVALIDRKHRPLALTEAGKLYNEFCRETLRRYEEFEAALDELRTAVVGKARVAAIFSVGLSEMSKLQAEFDKRWPQAELEVQYMHPEKIYQAIRSDRADIGLVSYPQPAKDITIIDWREEEMAVAVASGHPLARKSRVAPRELEAYPFVSFDPDLPIRREVNRFLKEQGADIDVAQHFGSIPEIKEALYLPKYFSILPLRMMQAEITQHRLAAVAIDGPRLVRPLGIIHLRKKRLNSAAKALLGLLRES